MAGLYHYTTGAGLLGMLKDYSADNPNLTMRATHYMYMNDPQEYIYGEKICKSVITEFENSSNIDNDKKISLILHSPELEEIRMQEMRHFGAKAKKIAINTPYLISFSKKADTLYMWRMYAKNGNGLALQFDEEELKKCDNATLKECLYYEEPAKSLIDICIQEIYKKQVEFIDNNPQYFQSTNPAFYKLTRAHVIASTVFMEIGAFIKHSAYKEEFESRLIVKSADNILFREKEGILFPFVEKRIPIEYIKSITIGPTADFNRVRESILLLLNSKGIKWTEDKIIKSNVPYRV